MVSKKEIFEIWSNRNAGWSSRGTKVTKKVEDHPGCIAVNVSSNWSNCFGEMNWIVMKILKDDKQQKAIQCDDNASLGPMG